MFERNNSRSFLSAGKGRRLPRLETLEDRAVPAVIALETAAMSPLSKATPPKMTPTPLPAADTVATSTTPGTIDYSVNFTVASTDSSRFAALHQFDPSLGTLTSVDIIATGSSTTSAKVENLGANPGDFNAQINADIRYNVAGTIIEATPTFTKTETLAAFDGTADLKGPSSTDFGGPITLTGSFPTMTTLTASADIAAYIGTGTVNVIQDASATSCSCGTGNLLSMVTTKASGDVKVVYHYTPTPTPPPPPDTFPPPPPDTFLPSKDLFIFYL